MPQQDHDLDPETAGQVLFSRFIILFNYMFYNLVTCFIIL